MLKPSSSLWISSCLGLELVISPDGKTVFHGTRIRIEGKSLTFEKKVTDIASLEALRAAFPGEPYTALVISGKGILHKKISGLEVVDAKAMGQILPNASQGDFYIQNFQSGECSYISLMRKSDADTWTARLTASGFKLLSLSFGPFPVQSILNQLNIGPQDCSFAGHQVQRDEKGAWLNWATGIDHHAAFPVKVEAETLDQDLLVAYGSAFQLLYFHKLDPVIAEAPALEAERAELAGNKKLQTWGMLLLFSFFLLLVINFLALSYYSPAVKKLSLVNRNTSEERSQVQARLDQINAHAALLDSVGYNGGLNEAKLIGQLAAGLPAGMNWKALVINPLDEAKARNEKKTGFLDHHIRIQGECGQVGAINGWIENARKLPWVKSIVLGNYAISPESGKGEFIIQVNY